MTEQELKRLETHAHNIRCGELLEAVTEIRRLQSNAKEHAGFQSRMGARVAKLEKQIADAPIVYGREISGIWQFWNYSDEHRESDTHTARLVDIKKLDPHK